MPDLMVVIDDKTLPLTNCVWIKYRPCGCPCGVLSAAFGDTTFATEDQAAREFTPLKKDRDRAARQGFTLELVTFEHYRKAIDILASCDACKPKKQEAAA